MKITQDVTKILLIGLGDAGKTSIYSRFFLQYSIEDIQGIQPTIFYSINQPVMDFITSSIMVYDLGGQSTFRERYLKEPTLFKNTRLIIFVVDIKKPELIDKIQEYFSEILELVRSVNPTKMPLFITFLHKYDPGKWDELTANIPLFIMAIKKLMKDEEISFQTSSVYDDSVHRAMVTALLKSLPSTAIVQSLDARLLNYALSTIPSIYEKQKVVDPTLDLYTFAISFGREMGNRLRMRWVSFALGIVDQGRVEEADEFLIRLTSDNKLEFQIKCPLRAKKLLPSNMIIAGGLIDGIANFLGFPGANLVNNEIKGDYQYLSFVISDLKED